MKFRFASLATALVALAISFFAMVAPIAHAQNIPAVGKPTIVGSFCPYCKAYFDTPNGKMPSACPRCHRSFVQQEKPAPAQAKPKLKAIDPFGDFLFYDVPIRPDDGKLQTRHLDPEGLAAKAEAWGKEMKQVDEQTRKKQQELAAAFERDKQALLGNGQGTAQRKLNNPFAGDPNVVDLRHLGDSAGTPDLLRQSDPKQPSEHDIPRDGNAVQKPMNKTERSGDDLILGSTLARAIATKDATVTLKPYQQAEVEKVISGNGWVIAARDLDGEATPYLVNKISGREDNPYGMHWQILLPNGESVGYFNGTKVGEDGKTLPNIKSESGAQYKGVVATGGNGAAMTEAVNKVKARWDARYVADSEGQEYDAGAHNCQDFTGEVLREYQQLLSKEQ